MHEALTVDFKTMPLGTHEAFDIGFQTVSKSKPKMQVQTTSLETHEVLDVG